MQSPEFLALETWIEPTVEALDVRETEATWGAGTDGGGVPDSTLS
ncbi:MAG: hypothetical protein JWN66_2627 [Sphingomonas bacterium]|nr:hypothetical protein [Sphingomonas bacterium]